MKATGVVRRIDDLGRVVIPKEIRKTLRIKEGDPLEIFTDKEGEVISADDKNKILSNVTPVDNLKDLSDSDIFLEAATEDLSVKKEIFKVSLGASLGVLLFTEIGIMIKFFKGFNWIIFLIMLLTAFLGIFIIYELSKKLE